MEKLASQRMAMFSDLREEIEALKDQLSKRDFELHMRERELESLRERYVTPLLCTKTVDQSDGLPPF